MCNMMLGLIKLFVVCFAIFSTHSAKLLLTEEDLRIVNETIKRYGPPQNWKELDLPGPELFDLKRVHYVKNIFEQDANEPQMNYTIKTRAVTPLFNYNRRYEEGICTGLDKILTVKGQFGEHFERKSGGFYIRTIGYILDENGYRQFLVDVSTAEIQDRVRISSAVLASLTGGGIG